MGIARGVKRWWRRPDHFNWLSGYLQSRDLTVPTRRLMAVVGLSLVLAPVNVLWGPPSINVGLAVCFSVAGSLAGVGWAILWLTRWPTKRQSIAFAMTGSACIVLGAVTQADPLVAMLACSALAVPGGYLAFFHTAPATVVNLALAVVVGADAMIRLALAGDTLIGITAYFLVLELNVAVPLAIQIVVGALGIDLLESDRDPLTGLLNRRAFQHAAVGALVACRDPGRCLVLAMVDLDRFKAINDARGHAGGDAVLVSVGSALQNNMTETAVVGRVGGEEFLVADVVSTAVVPGFGPRICSLVDAIPFSFPLTASVGTAAATLHTACTGDAIERYRWLVQAADAAMYTAKRRGGNRAHHWAGSPATESPMGSEF
ncbi:GGDEF domain-containing protein [Mycolicibacterium palauense]|uniref:GGDEF domain-containing protein n=1 Tax=Mycolicibacterium palauense TaxID=2034511 RepID=UPI001FE4803F|nr:diguanylate cyclase [Mycolicibacterium palauense]